MSPQGDLRGPPAPTSAIAGAPGSSDASHQTETMAALLEQLLIAVASARYALAQQIAEQILAVDPHHPLVTAYASTIAQAARAQGPPDAAAPDVSSEGSASSEVASTDDEATSDDSAAEDSADDETGTERRAGAAAREA
ncbi:hypothetical protein CXG81DRAFT_28853 [Caulochytrium protostelioides]|uniref:Uncharacterized protein n=1 Tax=Caulochytrium protostelioides TaxID=1555241 RepID=A0A4P9X0B9_9FUNG|nr:hypothetical protein CXG81DRAFT_28853 [Caulochytrium protostelioides]|eukprot:RKO98305.1 hypothetical protein CXG81DRAFT_28853 [Caulochytrium protostelioides]